MTEEEHNAAKLQEMYERLLKADKLRELGNDSQAQAEENVAQMIAEELGLVDDSGSVMDPVGPSGRTYSDILGEYEARTIQVERLQDELAETTDPLQRQYLQDSIQSHQTILTEIRQEASDVGIPVETLNTIDGNATAIADSNPIDLESSDELLQEAEDLDNWSETLKEVEVGMHLTLAGLEVAGAIISIPVSGGSSVVIIIAVVEGARGLDHGLTGALIASDGQERETFLHQGVYNATGSETAATVTEVGLDGTLLAFNLHQSYKAIKNWRKLRQIANMDELATGIRDAGNLPSSRQTVAITSTNGGATIIHAQPDLSDAQKLLAKSKDLDIAPDFDGLHAEIGTMSRAGDLRLQPATTRVTNRICKNGEGNCVDLLNQWYSAPGSPTINWHIDGRGFDIQY